MCEVKPIPIELGFYLASEILKNPCRPKTKLSNCPRTRKGVGVLFCSVSVILYITFLWAYFFNDYVFSTRINAFGEAHIEFVVLPISIILGLYASFVLFKQMLKGIQKEA